MTLCIAKKYVKFASSTLIACSLLLSQKLEADTIGIIGGDSNEDNPPPDGYVALVSSSGLITPIPGIPIGGIHSVAMNSSANSLVGGEGPSNASYAAFISSSGVITSISGLPSGIIWKVAINSAGNGIIGGIESGNAYAALVSSSGGVTALSGPPANGIINSVAINDAGDSIIGGYAYGGGGAAYAALVSSSGDVTSIAGIPPATNTLSVAINSIGNGIIGGGGTDLYAALVSSSGAVTPLITAPNPGGDISGVAINDAGMALIGGEIDNEVAYAAFVSPSGELASISGLPSKGVIQSVAINSQGNGLIGGQEYTNDYAYVALVSPSGNLRSISGLPMGLIRSVAINDEGNGLIGGDDWSNDVAYAALVTSSGDLIPIPGLPSRGTIESVALISYVPTTGLSGNNLKLAKYINQYSPNTAFYFIPSIVDGTLSQALESAAPTRNAFSLWAVDQVLFSLDTVLSSRAFTRRLSHQKQKSIEVAQLEPTQLLVSTTEASPPPPPPQEKPWEIWVSLLGIEVYQKQQHQTPSFNPLTGGIVLGFDGKVAASHRLGTGAAYAYTYLTEDRHAGHSHIQQEYLFVYHLWQGHRWYSNAALWGGAFQIDNVRNIEMTGFKFTSKSHPNGWQLEPHLELGYTCFHSSQWWNVEPFVMFDWVANWQESYKEKGSGPLNFGQKRHFSSMLRSEVSTRFYQTIFRTNWNFSFEEKIGYVNKKPFQVGTVNTFLVGSPGSLTVETLTTTQNLGVGQFQLALERTAGGGYPTMTIFQYQGEFGSMYQSHMVMLEFNWKF